MKKLIAITALITLFVSAKAQLMSPCLSSVLAKYGQPGAKGADSVKHTTTYIAELDGCIKANPADTLSYIIASSIKTDLYFSSGNYTKAIECIVPYLAVFEAYDVKNKNDISSLKVRSELYFKLGYSQVKTGGQKEGCANMNKAVDLIANKKYSDELGKLCE